MSVSRKTKIIIVSAAAVIAVGGCAGAILLGGQDVVRAGTGAVYASEDSSVSSASQSEADSVPVTEEEPEAEPEKLSFTQFKKAPVEVYDMSYVKEASASEKVQDPNNFTVEFPKDEGEYYDIHNDPLGFTSTRSIAGEFYTVNDIHTGATVTMNAHDLICSAVYSEIGDGWSEEAIKAQAVAAYTCLRFNAEHGILETVGIKRNYTSTIERCVSAVEGQVLLYNGEIINAVYSASTAGYSTASRDIWGGDYPYLQRVRSVYDSKDPNWGVPTTKSKAEVKSILEKKVGFTLSDDVTKWFTITSAFSGKYIRTITITGNSGQTATISGEDMCSLFGLKSLAMDISFKDGYFTFKTYGWGHGSGMSQWGCCYYAAAGWTYDQILSHYYVNTQLALSSYYTQSSEPSQTDSSSADTANIPQNTPEEGSQPAAQNTEPDNGAAAQTEPEPSAEPAPDTAPEQQAQTDVTEQTLS